MPKVNEMQTATPDVEGSPLPAQESELQPCPFCGSAAEYDDPMLPERSLIACTNRRCITRSPIRGGKKEWNTRASGASTTFDNDMLAQIDRHHKDGYKQVREQFGDDGARTAMLTDIRGLLNMIGRMASDASGYVRGLKAAQLATCEFCGNYQYTEARFDSNTDRWVHYDRDGTARAYCYAGVITTLISQHSPEVKIK